MYEKQVGNYTAKINNLDFPEKGLVEPKTFDVVHLGLHHIGRFTLAPMIGCCGVVISTNTYLFPQFRGLYHSKGMHDLKQAVAEHLGYSLMLCTVQGSNVPQLAGAWKAGWRVVHTFTNSRTGHLIHMMTKNL
jgi:hypothetical protein